MGQSSRARAYSPSLRGAPRGLIWTGFGPSLKGDARGPNAWQDWWRGWARKPIGSIEGTPMKKVAGLLVATGLLVTASYSFGKPPAPKGVVPAAKKSAQAKAKSKSTQSGGADVKELEATAGSVVWAAADRDGDGAVSFGEFATIVNDSIARRVATRFRQLDRNKDGRCTRAEVNKMTAERFARFDANHDG